MKKYIYFILLFLLKNTFSQTLMDSTNISTFVFNGNEYEIIKEAYTWTEAAMIANERGGILTEINSQSENDTIFYYLNQAGIDKSKTIAPDGGNASYVWIGGNDIKEEGSWFWDGNNDGIGFQFWEGTVSGNTVGEAYNNWGNEPDNFGNQDALGLALTNWARGVAGQWNDVQEYNKLYFVIEYDHSTFKTNTGSYFYQENLMNFDVDFEYQFDSVQVVVDNHVHETFTNISSGNSVFESFYYADSTRIINVYLKAYRESIISFSNPFQFETYSFKNPVLSYQTYFEDTPIHDFMTKSFEIGLSGGFRDKAIHSPHNYENNSELTITLKNPIEILPVPSVTTYSE